MLCACCVHATLCACYVCTESVALPAGAGHLTPPSPSPPPAHQMGSMTEDERAEVLGRWLLRDLKAASSLLLQAGLEFEDF